ncbi:phosphatidylinositol phosphate synthase [Litorihabitans aurantiacus]|uniref:Phosphatidylinositol phosphate synthase n=1 Tax=Litorihabitans aurantiacus TaxID=1930061 RepID=A0AA38CNN6_9MICO|nr:CDP-alcohol phosphatidyltransferase family protein [Litorihabitans aurantiacus]GMA31388.1 CDP-alcohol phosphatidyltransferase [Litorihabitans aurantiacus]
MLKHLRAVVGRILRAPAALLLRLGVTPDVVTIVGTLGAMAGSLGLIARGQLFAGTMVITFFVLFDVLDGTMARLAGTTGPWGAFLDSVLDRFADGALFAALTIHLAATGERVGAAAALACLVLGSIVPYARAKAESLGRTATVGIAERGDRLLIALVATGLVGLGLPVAVLVVVLVVLAVLSLTTSIHRMLHVRRQILADASSTAPAPGAAP